MPTAKIITSPVCNVTCFEQEKVARIKAELAKEDQLRAFRHRGFWQAMDTLRDKNQLEELWQGTAPWKVWS